MLTSRCLVPLCLLLGCTKHDLVLVAAPDGAAVLDADSEDAPVGIDGPSAPGNADGAGQEALPRVTCAEVYRHQQACGRLPDGGDTTEAYCAKLAELEAKWRPEFSASFFPCLVNHACSLDDDECMMVALRTSATGLIDLAKLDACFQNPTPPCDAFTVFQGVAADCVHRRADCVGDGGVGFPVDYCVSITALTDAGRAQVPACLAQDCSAVGRCLADLGAIAP